METKQATLKRKEEQEKKRRENDEMAYNDTFNSIDDDDIKAVDEYLNNLSARSPQ